MGAFLGADVPHFGGGIAGPRHEQVPPLGRAHRQGHHVAAVVRKRVQGLHGTRAREREKKKEKRVKRHVEKKRKGPRGH